MKQYIKQLKIKLKELELEIKDKKSKRKGSETGYVSGLWEARYRARHYHIAYCQLRGRTYEQIENKATSKPNIAYIETLMDPNQEKKSGYLSVTRIDNKSWNSDEKIIASAPTQTKERIGLLAAMVQKIKGV